MGKIEKAQFIEMMKQTGHDPKAMAECVRRMLLQDQDDDELSPKKRGDDKAVIEATKDILRSL